MKISSAPVLKRPTIIIGWLTVFTQAALPLSIAYAPLAHAAQSSETSPVKWYQSADNNGQPSYGQSADALTGVGAALAQDNSVNAATGMARSAATGALNNSAQEWLSQFGTARVQLNVDEKFRTNGSEADLLVPLYENESTLLFTQLGLRHVDDRNTGNAGIGARHFIGDWMLGANTFFDNDFSGKNRRLGLGVEAWRDYLKLSANSYIRLSDWHQSRDFIDYDERPANGYDVRAEGWLPAFPQLGAKVMFEQYQGDEVALFGKDNRQSDPWAFTGGVNYTPVPLVTLGAQHRAGKAGQSDSQLSLQLNYRLGEPWRKQIDPNLVGETRTLNGSRYDLVERNNTIVLDYRKQETVTLVLPEKAIGKSRSVLPLSFSVKTKHPLQRIDWDSAALIAAGGSITQVGTDSLSITLPAYQAGSSNLYHFTGVAYDTQGNSGSATAQIVVEAEEVNAAASKVTLSANNLTADGKSTTALKIELFDGAANPASGIAKSLSASITETLVAIQSVKINANAVAQPATIGAIEEVSPGVYQAIITAGNRVSSIEAIAQLNDTVLPSVTITQNADASSGYIDSGAILATVDNSIANASAANQVAAKITDAGGNPLANIAVTFSLSGSATAAAGSSLNATTDNKGRVNLSLINKVAEAVTVTATLENGNTASVETHFIADSSSASTSSSDITVDKTSIVANNSDVAIYSAVVKDANGNPVPNFTVNWTTNKGILSGSNSTTDSDGRATITLKHNVVEAVQVTAQAGTSGKINAPAVSFTADSASATIGAGDITVDKTTLVANNLEQVTYTAIVKDAGGNPLPNLTVTWATNLGVLSATTSTTDAAGKATISLQGIVAGEAQVTASVNGATPVNADKVTFTGDPTTAVIDTNDVTVDNITLLANNIDIVTFTARVKDANANPIAGLSVNWTTNNGTLSGVSSDTDSNGLATITLKGTKAGPAQVAAAVNTTKINAPLVTLNVDISKLKITSITTSSTSIIGVGTGSTTLTAKVEDAFGNAVADQTVKWSSSLGTLSDTTSETDSRGIATIILTAPIVTGASDERADVVADIASDSKTYRQLIRTTLLVGGKYYWSMVKDSASFESSAERNCSIQDGGRVATESDLKTFAAQGGDFASKSVSGEYTNDWYRLGGGQWDTKSGDFHSTGTGVGDIRTIAGTGFVCVK